MTSDKDSEAGWVYFWMLLVVVCYMNWSSIANSKLRYVIEYSTNWNRVTIEPRPKDCDFMSSPLGRKNCHYEAEVNLVRDGGGGTNVLVGWVRKTS